MKYKLIKTTVNVKTYAVCQTIDICNNEKELENYWKQNSNIAVDYRSSSKVGDVSYFIYHNMLKRFIILAIVIFVSLIAIISFILGNYQWITESGGGYNVGRGVIVIMSLFIPLYIVQCK